MSDERQVEILSDMLRRIVYFNLHDDIVLRQTRDIVRDVPPREYAAEAASVLEWVKRSVRYTRDTTGIELFSTGRRLLTEYDDPDSPIRGHGDCDDLSTLIASMMMSIGHQAAIFLCDGLGNGMLNHAFPAVKFPKPRPPFGSKWVVMDASVDHELGWVAPLATTFIPIELNPKKMGDDPRNQAMIREMYVPKQDTTVRARRDDDRIHILQAR